jgi:GntR family transcriptional regulator, carbon starvation induced regulator
MSKKTLVWGPAPRAPSSSTSRTLADTAFELIREDIIHGRLVSGEKLRPDVLRERHGIGLSPVREALSRLASDGLAAAEGRRGYFVAPVLIDELLDVTRLRIEFSVMALRASIALGDEKWESEVVATFYRLNKLHASMRAEPSTYADQWEDCNRAFHTVVGAACGSPWLLHFCNILYDHSERYRRSFVTYPSIEAEVHDGHQVILDAILARDAEAASEALRSHIDIGADKVRKLMAARSNTVSEGRKTPVRQVYVDEYKRRDRND